MQPAADSKTIEQATRAFKARMLRAAIAHLDKMDAFSALRLEDAEVFERAAAPSIPEDLFRILQQQDHPKRNSSVSGPTLFYRDNDQRQFAIEMEYLLLSEESRVRQAAWQYFQSVGRVTPTAMTAATHSLFTNARSNLLCEDRPIWRPIALELYEAIRADIYSLLSGARQAVANNYEDGLRKFVPALLEPRIQSLEALQLPFIKPSEQAKQMEDRTVRLLAMPGRLPDKCDSYIEELGFVPIGGGSSFALFAKALITRSADERTSVLELWEWAQRHDDRLAQLNVVIAVLENPTWIAHIGSSVILATILKLVPPAERKRQDESLIFLKLHEELTRYYLRYLELSAPGAWGEVLAVWACWLGNEVSQIFHGAPAMAPRFRSVALLPKRQLVDVAWRLSNVHVISSRIGTAIHWPSSLWVLSLINKFNETNLRALQSDQPSRESLETLALALTPTLLFGDVPQREKSVDSYLFDGRVANVVEAWATVHADPERIRFWKGLVETYAELSKTASFLEKFESIFEADEPSQLILAHAARRLELEKQFPSVEILSQFEKREWRNKLFERTSLGALEVICTLLIATTASEPSRKEYIGVPHLFATICEELEGDTTRQELAFSLMICACFNFFTVGPIDRLLRSGSRACYFEVARHWSNTFTELNRFVPRWFGARARACQAALGACLGTE